MGKRNAFASFRDCAGTGLMMSPCDYYDLSAGECLLLRERKMDEFWEKGQCAPFEILYNSVSNCLDRLKNKYRYFPLDEREDVDFCKLVSRLKRKGLKREFNLGGWRKYVNKAVYREIRDILIKRGLIPGAANCGTCRHLTLSKPHVCQKTGAFGKKSDKTCDAYMWHRHVFVSADSENNGVLKKSGIKNEVDKMGGENMKTPATLMEEKEEGRQFLLMKEMLAKRAEEAEVGSKRKEKFERQYEIFSNLLILLSDGVPYRGVRTVLAEKTRIHIRTIRRDIEEIMIFLRKACDI